MLLFGSVLGALWMMTLYGVPLPAGLIDIVRLHRSVQFDGFITMLIMGIGYMIVPRFRNIPLPSPKLAYISYVLMVGAVIIPILHHHQSQTHHHGSIAVSLVPGYFAKLVLLLFLEDLLLRY